MRKFSFAVLICMVATIVASDADGQGKRRFITIGTGGPSGVYFVVGQSVCRMVGREAGEGRKKGRKHGLRCAASSSAGSIYNIKKIRDGEFEFGLAQSDWQYHAYNGTSRFKDKRFDKLRAVFSVHSEPFQLIVGKDSGIKSWADLRGKRVNIGNPGSGHRATMEVLMKAHRWKMSDFAAATELNSSEHSKALCDGTIDAYVYAVGVPNRGVAEATNGCDARIIDLDGKVEKKLVDETPYYAWATIPKGTYETTKADVTTFGTKATFITSADVPGDVVYEVVRAVFENLVDFRTLHRSFAKLKPEEMIRDGLSAPLHPGAVKYYKEKGQM